MKKKTTHNSIAKNKNKNKTNKKQNKSKNDNYKKSGRNNL